MADEGIVGRFYLSTVFLQVVSSQLRVRCEVGG